MMFLGQNTTSLDDVGLSSAINRTASDYTDSGEKVKKIRELIRTGNYGADIARYISGVPKLVFQGMLADIDFKEKPEVVSYKDMEQLGFQILLPGSYYVNTSSIHICFPITINDLVTVNNFSAYIFLLIIFLLIN